MTHTPGFIYIQIITRNEFSYLTQLFVHRQPVFVLDLGGNCGISSLFFSSVWFNSTVVSVEPHRSNFAIARLNTFNQANVFFENAAIWADMGYAVISGSQSHLHGHEWGLKFEELPSAAKSLVTHVIPRIK